MPGDPTVWIVGILVAGAVLIAALWLGRGFSFTKSGDKTSLKIDSAASDKKSSAEQVKVGEGLKIEDAQVRNVTGVSGPHGDNDADVEVLKGGSIKGSEVGDITGRQTKARADEDD